LSGACIFEEFNQVWLNLCSLFYQTAFGKLVLEGQLSKLGILPPEGTFWPALKTAFNTMWANNGDVLSRQYAGTNALKVLQPIN
jgi:hypothetical protein